MKKLPEQRIDGIGIVSVWLCTAINRWWSVCAWTAPPSTCDHVCDCLGTWMGHWVSTDRTWWGRRRDDICYRWRCTSFSIISYTQTETTWFLAPDHHFSCIWIALTGSHKLSTVSCSSVVVPAVEDLNDNIDSNWNLKWQQIKTQIDTLLAAKSDKNVL